MAKTKKTKSAGDEVETSTETEDTAETSTEETASQPLVASAPEPETVRPSGAPAAEPHHRFVVLSDGVYAQDGRIVHVRAGKILDTRHVDLVSIVSAMRRGKLHASRMGG